MGWLRSVSRTVFFLVAFTACFGFITGRLPVDKFMELALMAFSFFFAIKQVTKPEDKTNGTEVK